MTRADLPPKPTRALIIHTHPITAGPQTRARSRRALELERAVTIANDLIKGLSELIDPLRTPALARAWKTLEAERPPGTVHGWARRAHTSRATLWREWKSLGLPDMLTLSFLVRSAFLRSRLTSDHEENSPPPAPQINEFDKRRCRRLARQIIAVGVMLGYADDDSAKGQA